MSPRPKIASTPSPYPYKIPSIAYLKKKELKDSSSKNVLEFLRIEALLRSKDLIKLYRATFGAKPTKNGDAIVIEQGIIFGWGIRKGEHHVLLLKSYLELETQRTGQSQLKSGIHDLQIELLQESAAMHERVMEGIQERMSDSSSPFLWLEIDVRYTPTSICKKLKEMLKAKLDTYNAHLKRGASPTHSSPKTTSLDPHTWIDYFQCYDIRHCEGKSKSFGEIAIKVYGDSEKREVAEHAYKRVCKLIEYAESNIWPPPSNFLNKK